jgi:hypothetical protein
MTSASASAHRPFDTRLVRLHRARAARSGDGAHFLAQRAADDVCERLVSVNRTFARTLVVGGAAAFRAALTATPEAAAKVSDIVAMDWPPSWARDGIVAARCKSCFTSDKVSPGADSYSPFKLRMEFRTRAAVRIAQFFASNPDPMEKWATFLSLDPEPA